MESIVCAVFSVCKAYNAMTTVIYNKELEIEFQGTRPV